MSRMNFADLFLTFYEQNEWHRKAVKEGVCFLKYFVVKRSACHKYFLSWEGLHEKLKKERLLSISQKSIPLNIIGEELHTNRKLKKERLSCMLPIRQKCFLLCFCLEANWHFCIQIENSQTWTCIPIVQKSIPLNIIGEELHINIETSQTRTTEPAFPSYKKTFHSAPALHDLYCGSSLLLPFQHIQY